ncbi:ATP-binding cassette domain-containing protein [Demequina sp. TTPB684]|uniref:ABC transporter ATP-binding protein n=1 Tax=unclassified Demequina TaxID=2620311 RepID=UPI001CF4A8AF|nr:MULTISPECIES: ATP-binding cassette domain-containing protein [unclassified Demequina]MCB2412481.1 ATP-binding cassette domain-containing protein [Demequina sp. TTPB684]UPU87686.1 ATP-binding cassette domain-containing protein [Demequina sp. TMPB413]
MPLTLHVSGLTQSFGNRKVLDNVTFDVRPGRVTGFVGANGAGKTTTMRAIVGVLAPDAGTVTWGNAPMTLDARRRVGYMPEERGLYPKMKVRDQLVYLARIFGVETTVAGERADALLADFGLADRAGDLLHTLSLGNQQRVQVAAALIHEPELLVLDEPFSGLDPIAMDAMAERLTERARAGVPVLFSSHQLDLVERLCDDIVLIHEGRVLAAGTAQALRDERAGSRYRVGVEGAPEWRPTLAGADVVAVGSESSVIELGEGVDPQALLADAQRAGAVTHFSRAVPSLSELFAEVTR